MEIINDYPPNWEKIKKIFPVDNAEVVMAYNGNIYNPFKLPLRDDLIFHEMVHIDQQDRAKEKGITIDQWWERYANNKESRIELEAQAYGKQIQFIRKNQGEKRAVQALTAFSNYLSGPIYGSVITRPNAFKKLIRMSH